MSFTVPKLPFAHDALEPYLSQDNVHFHYGKHTKKYFDTSNELIKGTMYAKYETLEKLVGSGRLRKETALYNNVYQAYNHQQYWENVAPKDEAGKPSAELMELFDKQCDGFDKFKERFVESAGEGFGSYWMWLTITEDDKMIISTTHNADRPDGIVLLVVDGWEHSWYPTYHNDRAKYFKNIWHIINWNTVNERLERTRTTKKAS